MWQGLFLFYGLIADGFQDKDPLGYDSK